MNGTLPIADCRLPIERQDAAVFAHSIVNRKSKIVNGFTLIEVMVVMVLLSLIVLALMAVFNSAQTAFRTGVTQVDVLEGGRATMDLMGQDLRAMAPSHSATNFAAVVTTLNSPPSPLIQSLVGSSGVRTNVLENFFILSRNNVNGQDVWTGTGYVVGTNSAADLYPLYRFSSSLTNFGGADPSLLFNAFLAAMSNGRWTNMSHLMDGVLSLTVLPYDVNGGLMTANIVYAGGQSVTNQNVLYYPPVWGQTGFIMFSNTLPASVEVEMGVLEDRTLQRAESLNGSWLAQSNFLSGAAGAVHIFRQRVAIPNLDPSAYQ